MIEHTDRDNDILNIRMLKIGQWFQFLIEWRKQMLFELLKMWQTATEKFSFFSCHWEFFGKITSGVTFHQLLPTS